MKKVLYAFLALLTIYFLVFSSYVFAENNWKIYNLTTSNGEVFRIPYNIIEGNVDTIESSDANILIKLKDTKQGIFEISIPRNLLDEKIGTDQPFLVLLDKIEVPYRETNTNPCFRTALVEFTDNTQEVEFLATFTEHITPKSAVPPVQILSTTIHDDGNVLLEGCTSLNIYDASILIDVINSQGITHKAASVQPNMDGTFSTSFRIDKLKTIESYTITATYANYTAVPEFPIVPLILASSILAILLFKTDTIKHVS